MSMIESIKEFVDTCPFIGELSIEYLGSEPNCYSINPVPADPVVKNYLDGSSYRRFTFIVTSREWYGPDVLQQLENSSFYERFAEWIDACNRNKVFPELDTEQQPVAIRAIDWGYAFQTDIDRAQYQIQCQLEYRQGVK